jgi:hypothetical protein
MTVLDLSEFSKKTQLELLKPYVANGNRNSLLYFVLIEQRNRRLYSTNIYIVPL